MAYIGDDQEDLVVQFKWYEDLTGYTGKIRYYHLQSGSVTSPTCQTATVTAASTLTTVKYTVQDGGPIWTDPGTWVVWAVVTSSTGKERACKPEYVDVRTPGVV